MLIHEVTTPKPAEPSKARTAAQQRVTALQSQLARARDGVKRERLAQRQLALNQARAELNQP
jgi:hypothetical protein